ncbi:unnamed protein product [Adineta ricciae]|uniref:Uncharacterized protein n=1 Tax=Adineta ricciae TaxID=249248 RepID=A0A814GQE8_ADIRI|nr:unnamed protein product [Adineta ricciae]
MVHHDSGAQLGMIWFRILRLFLTCSMEKVADCQFTCLAIVQYQAVVTRRKYLPDISKIDIVLAIVIEVSNMNELDRRTDLQRDFANCYKRTVAIFKQDINRLRIITVPDQIYSTIIIVELKTLFACYRVWKDVL